MTKEKAHYRKLIIVKKQKVMSQMKGQDKTPEKKTKWNGYRQPSRKRIQNNDNEDDLESQKQNRGIYWEDARNVYQRPKGTKEQTDE